MSTDDFPSSADVSEGYRVRSAWWYSLTAGNSDLISREMCSEALWCALKLSALDARQQFLSKGIKHPDAGRGAGFCQRYIAQAEAIAAIASTLNAQGVLAPNGEAFQLFRRLIDSMLKDYEKQFSRRAW